jgi:hypothetical protein
VRCYVNIKVDSEIHRVGWLKLPSSAKNTNLEWVCRLGGPGAVRMNTALSSLSSQQTFDKMSETINPDTPSSGSPVLHNQAVRVPAEMESTGARRLAVKKEASVKGR